MTKVSFDKQGGKYCKLTVMGHSGYAEEGSDIVCAAISSMVNLTTAVLEKSGIAFAMNVGSKTPTIIIQLTDTENAFGQNVFEALYSEMIGLSESFTDYVKVTVAERTPQINKKG